jgi:hypothetical protein
MSHQVQLSPAASHRPNCRPGPGRRRWAAGLPQPMSVLPRPDRTCARYFPPLGDSICRASCPPPPKIPGQARGPAGRTNPRGPATIPPSVRWQARFPRRGKRPEDTAGTWRAALHAGPSGRRSASKAHDRDRPAGYPGATCHRPPRDPRRDQMQASPRQWPSGPPGRPSRGTKGASGRVNPLGWSHRRGTCRRRRSTNVTGPALAVDARGAATAGWRSVPVAGWVRVLGC